MKCQHCQQSNDPHNHKKWHGYCFDCGNKGVPDMKDRIAELEAENNKYVGWLKHQMQINDGQADICLGLEKRVKYLEAENADLKRQRCVCHALKEFAAGVPETTFKQDETQPKGS